MTENGWNKYEELVLFRLTAIEDMQAQHTKKLDEIQTSVALLKLKVGLIGTIFGAISGFVASFITGP